MNDTLHCGNHEALVAYLYDEGEPGDREAIAAHIGHCVTCAEEVEALRSTRRVLAAWTPPDASLGFRITQAEAAAPAPVLRPSRWWRQPLPAWAQVAAAAVIFAAGVTLGSARGTSDTRETASVEPPAAPSAQVTVAPAAVQPPAASITRDELARLERRLLAIESAARTAAPAPVMARAAVNEDELLERVRQLIEASEQRQLVVVGDLAGHLERQRRALLAVDERVARVQGQNNAVSTLMRGVAFQPVSVR